MNEELYKAFKAARESHSLWPNCATQRLRIAKSQLVQRVKDALRGTDDPRHPQRIAYLLIGPVGPGGEIVCAIKGHGCSVRLEADDWTGNDDIDGVTLSRNRNPYREVGWGHDGMDQGLYALNSDTLISFNETRLEIITHAPPMSKQLKYEWATELMKCKLERAKQSIDGDALTVGAIIECPDLDIHEALWGIEITGDDKLDISYVQEVVEDLYHQVEYEIDRQKKVA